jgi:hypothetical protein
MFVKCKVLKAPMVQRKDNCIGRGRFYVQILLQCYCSFLSYTLLAFLVGLAMEFCSEKIPWNRLGMASVILRKKVLIPRHSEVYGRVNSEAQNGRKWHEKI